MNVWHQYPLFRLIFPIILGIILSVSNGLKIELSLWVIVLVFLLYIIIAFSPFGIKYKSRSVAGIIIFIFILICSYNLCFVKSVSSDIKTEEILSSASQKILRITEAPENKEKSVKVIAKLLSIKKDNKWTKFNKKIIIYFEKSVHSQQLEYGDILLTNEAIREVNSPQNPHEFDYKRYLSLKNINYQAYIKSDKWKLLEKKQGKLFYHFTIDLRKKLLKSLKDNNIKDNEYAIASALLLGYKNNLDAELIKEFSGAGAMHILCVSGLHVGVIYLVLNYLLFFFDKIKYGKYLKSILLILFIWLYAFISGLSPSVQRASFMISFIIIGQMGKQNTSVYNSLLVSAIILIFANPLIIMEVGFQLSYLAVLGIVIIQPYVNKIFYSKYKLLDKAWSLISVSIAAQIATFPLGLYYFHQFPNYFILTNLIVIPLSALIIYSGILVLFGSAIIHLPDFIPLILSKLIKLLAFCVKSIENLPFSTSSNISITVIQMLILYLIIIFSVAFFHQKKYTFLRLTFFLFIALIISFSINKYEKIKQKRIVIYKVNNHSAYDFIDGKSCYFVADTIIPDKKMNFHISANRIQSHINNSFFHIKNDSLITKASGFYKQRHFINFYDKKIIIIDDVIYKNNIAEKIDVDYLLMTNNTRAKIDDIQNRFNAGILIFDSSNSYWKVEKWVDECKEKNIEYYSVLHSGAFVAEL